MRFEKDNIDKGLLYLAWFITFMWLFLLAGNVYGYDENGELEESRYCMAQNIYFEAANQSFAGKLAVAHVVINRVKDGQFPNTVCDVIYQAKTYTNWKGNEVPIRNQCQFSWYCDGLADDPVDSQTWMRSMFIAELVLTNQYRDITENALWYHADYVYPYWADELEYVTTIDEHIFYK